MQARLAFFRVHVAGWWKAWNFTQTNDHFFNATTGRTWVLEAFRTQRKTWPSKGKGRFKNLKHSGRCSNTWLMRRSGFETWKIMDASNAEKITWLFVEDWNLQATIGTISPGIAFRYQKQGLKEKTSKRLNHQQQTSTQHVCFWGTKSRLLSPMLSTPKFGIIRFLRIIGDDDFDMKKNEL